MWHTSQSSTIYGNTYSIHSQNGWTPLMRASFEGHIAIVRLLVEAKAQLNRQTEVSFLLPPEHNTPTQHHTLLHYYYIGELTVCSVHRMVQLLFF